MRYIIFTAALALAATSANAAVLVQYDFTGAPGNQVSNPALNAATGVIGTAFTRGAGLSAAAAGNSISSSGWSTAANDYYSFGFSVTGAGATVNQLIFGSQSSGTGPGFINVLASVDGGAFTQVGAYALETAVNLSQALTLSAPVIARSSVEFRLVAANNTSASGGTIAGGGTFRATNFIGSAGATTPFTIDGTLNQVAGAVPEPATWAMMLLGFGSMGYVMRRRRSNSVGVRFA